MNLATHHAYDVLESIKQWLLNTQRGASLGQFKEGNVYKLVIFSHFLPKIIGLAYIFIVSFFIG